MVLTREPDDRNTLFGKAVALHNLGRNEAITFFDMVLVIDSNNADN